MLRQSSTQTLKHKSVHGFGGTNPYFVKKAGKWLSHRVILQILDLMILLAMQTTYKALFSYDTVLNPKGPETIQVCHHNIGSQAVSNNSNMTWPSDSSAWLIPKMLQNLGAAAGFLRFVPKYLHPSCFFEELCFYAPRVTVRAGRIADYQEGGVWISFAQCLKLILETA